MTKYIFYSYNPAIKEHERYIQVYQPTVDKPRKTINRGKSRETLRISGQIGMTRNIPSNIYKRGNKYIVSQVQNKKKHHYGTYNTLEEAIQKRNKLAEQGIIKELRGKHRIRNHEDRYIYKYNTRYYIRKVVNKKQEHFGVFNTMEDAREERDFLESIGWDYSNMD